MNPAQKQRQSDTKKYVTQWLEAQPRPEHVGVRQWDTMLTVLTYIYRLAALSDDLTAYPWVRTISRETRKSMRTVHYSLRLAEELGLIEIEHQTHETGAQKSNLYHLPKSIGLASAAPAQGCAALAQGCAAPAPPHAAPAHLYSEVLGMDSESTRTAAAQPPAAATDEPSSSSTRTGINRYATTCNECGTDLPEMTATPGANKKGFRCLDREACKATVSKKDEEAAQLMRSLQEDSERRRIGEVTPRTFSAHPGVVEELLALVPRTG